MSEASTIVLVGHCGPDMFMLKSAVGRVVPGARIETINDARSLEVHLTSNSVLLVNRVLDGQFETMDGIELIRTVAGRDSPPVSLLISNLDDAQVSAVDAGARPGFGKSELYDERTAERIRAAVGVGG